MFTFLVNFQVSLCCSCITAYIAREFNSEMLRFPVIIKTTGRVRGIITLVTFVCFHRPFQMVVVFYAIPERIEQCDTTTDTGKHSRSQYVGNGGLCQLTPWPKDFGHEPIDCETAWLACAVFSNVASQRRLKYCDLQKTNWISPWNSTIAADVRKAIAACGDV